MTIFPSTHTRDFMTLAERDALIARVNPPENVINADDKIVTAQLAVKFGVPHVPTLGVIDAPDQIAGAVNKIRAMPSCVIKPARGTGGSGILFWQQGKKMTAHDLGTHLKNILDGLYSMGAQPDRALIQPLIQPHPFFTVLHGNGVADIRVIVYMGKPVMAMLRLPTRESGGKANLHAGAVGVGIDMATGVTTHGVYRGGEVLVHPDTGVVLARHVVPHWSKATSLAAGCMALFGLGCIGVDMVVGDGGEPILLEINARPGLSIQYANQADLAAVCQIS